MIYLFSFVGLREIEESRYRLPQKLIVQSFDEGFLPQERAEYPFDQPEDYEIFSGDIDRIVLEKWRPVMEDVLYDMEETPKLVFFAESDRRLFLSMKSKFRMHIGAWEYYSLESLLQLADLEENKSEFSLIREQLKEEYKTAAFEQKNAGSIEEKLESVCRKYGMKAEFRSGTAYITTYAGEWYFAYNDRPITLYHKNSIPVKGRNGDLIRHSHIQPVELYAPLQALVYIRNHEAAEERRLLGGQSECPKHKQRSRKAKHDGWKSGKSEERSGDATEKAGQPMEPGHEKKNHDKSVRAGDAPEKPERSGNAPKNRSKSAHSGRKSRRK